MNSRRPLPKIIAHRGLKTQFPENTKESIAAALLLPVYGVEFDVDLTKDDVPILIHQSTMIANWQAQKLELGMRDEGRNWTHDVEWDTIKYFDAGSYLKPQFSSIRFSTLPDVLDLNWGGREARVELKNPFFYRKDSTAAQRRDFAERIVAIAKPYIERFVENGGTAQVLSFDPDVLKITREELPNLPTTIAFDCCFDPKPMESLRIAKEVGASYFIVQDQWLIEDHRWVDEGLKLGLLPWAFELSPDASQMAKGGWSAASLQPNWRLLAEMGADGLHCNYPAECLSFFESLSE